MQFATFNFLSTSMPPVLRSGYHSTKEEIEDSIELLHDAKKRWSQTGKRIIGMEHIDVVDKTKFKECLKQDKINKSTGIQNTIVDEEDIQKIKEIWEYIAELMERFFFIIFSWFVGLVDIIKYTN